MSSSSFPRQSFRWIRIRQRRFRLAYVDSPLGVVQYHPEFPSSGQLFKTWPDPRLSTPQAGGTHFTFAFTSCIKIGFPYNGPFSDRRRVRGAEFLFTYLKSNPLDFMLFL